MPGLNVPYCTLEQLRLRFNVAAADTSDDVRLLRKCFAAGQVIDRYTARYFYPVQATRLFDWRNARSILFRGQDLLQLITLTNGDGNVIDPGGTLGAIITLGGINGPIYGFEINVAKGPFLNYLTTKTRALSVAGIWGWHDDYANTAWKSSNDAVTTFGVSGGATTVTVANVAGADAWGFSPRFQTGQMISIDGEFMLVTSISTGTNTLTVVRGIFGQTPASHLIGAAILTYSPPTDITEISLRVAAWLTRLEDSGEFGLTSGITADASAGGVHVPAHIPPDIQAELEPFKKIGSHV